MKITAITLAATAGLAMASPIYNSIQNPQEQDYALAGAGATHTFDLSGVESWDLFDDPDNFFSTTQFGGGNYFFGYSFDVTISTYGTSWLSEVTIDFSNSDGTGGLSFAPGIGDDFAGTASYSSGMIDLQPNDDFLLNPDGLFHLSVYESFDDNSNAADAIFEAGSSFRVHYVITPSPSGLTILGLAGLAVTRRRR